VLSPFSPIAIPRPMTSRRTWTSTVTGNIHRAFGGGPHRCVGSHLACRELTIEIEAWIRRIPDFYIPELIPNLCYATLGMWSLPHLPLRWRVPELMGN
jgi:cytochrome P450